MSVVICEIPCDPGNTAKFTKHSESEEASTNEYWIVRGDNRVMYDSRTTNVTEVCLDPVGSRDQYVLYLGTNGRNRWQAGSWLSVEGKYGNIFFKNFLYSIQQEEFPLSLHYFIKKGYSWRLANSAPTGSWMEFNYDDSSWSSVVLGTSISPVNGAQYFRYTYFGLSNMAAYEFSMKYKYGIVAYVNGMEVFRDNLPDGNITSTTTAISTHSSLSFHSIIRPGSEVSPTQLAVAVELHFLTATGQNNVDFDAYMAFMASSINGYSEPCFIYPDSISFLNENDANLFDFDHETFKSIKDLSLDYPLQKYAYLNGVRMLAKESYTIPSIQWKAKQGVTGNSWNTVISRTNVNVKNNDFTIINGYFNSQLSKNYRFIVSNLIDSKSLYEIQPLICSSGIPTSITYDQSLYSFYSKYQQVVVSPIVDEFTNCTIAPSLPEGLSIDSSTCIVSGEVNTVMSPTSYLVTSTMMGKTFTGSFQLRIDECLGTYVEIRRDYKANAADEMYSLIDTLTNQVILTDTHQVDGISHSDYLCLTGTGYTIEMSSSKDSWSPASYLYVFAIFYNDEKETILRANYDTVLGIKPRFEFSLNYAIKHNEQWYYSLNHTDYPSTWQSNSLPNWPQASFGSFPNPVNKFQFYKKQFTIADTKDIAGVIISLRYQYEFLIYINGLKAAQYGMSDFLGFDYNPTRSLNSVHMRQISLPIKKNNGYSFVSGVNTIAIAIATTVVSDTPATFDCAVRLTTKRSVSRVFQTSTTITGCSVQSDILQHHNTFKLEGDPNAESNSFEIQFDDNRLEWITSIAIQLHNSEVPQDEATAKIPRDFIFEGWNTESNQSGEWKLIRSISEISWSLVGQTEKIWLKTDRPYNKYRLKDVKGKFDNRWSIGSINLLLDALDVDMAPLSYHTERVELFATIEMGEIYPKFTEGYDFHHYYEFTIAEGKTLPADIHINPYTGFLSGTPLQTTDGPKLYTITAERITDDTKHDSFAIQVTIKICNDNESLISLVARSDAYPSEASYSVYKGKNAGGVTVASASTLFVGSNLNYGDFCLEHGVYTLVLRDTGNGWINPAGYYITVDVGEMVLDMGQVYTGTTPTVVSTTFSSALPFQKDFTDWDFYKVKDVNNVPKDWNSCWYKKNDDWISDKANKIGDFVDCTTILIRKEFTLTPDGRDLVLNVRVQYTGGIIAYLNGKKVARFNLAADADFNTPSLTVHDKNSWSKFHAILDSVSSCDGNYVMAFEVHRPIGVSQQDYCKFDATGVFGVVGSFDNYYCSIVVDEYDKYDEKDTQDYTRYFSFKPQDFYQLPTRFQWSVQNLEGTQFNSFGFQSVYARNAWSISLEAGPKGEVGDTLFNGPIITKERTRSTWMMYNGMIRHSYFKFQITDEGNEPIFFSSFIPQYCTPNRERISNMCEGIAPFPAVESAKTSYADCEDGYEGYMYRVCEGTTFGEIHKENCHHLPPAKLQYSPSEYTFDYTSKVEIPPPMYLNIIESFSLAEGTSLFEGMTLDTKTGAITGYAMDSGTREFTIIGSNPTDSTSTTIKITINKSEEKSNSTVWIIVIVVIVIVLLLILIWACWKWKLLSQCCGKNRLPGVTVVEVQPTVREVTVV